MMLQKPEDGFSRLKRVVLIGDHHQLPPVIQNMAFQKYSNMEQSLFTRFVRLGVPTVQLDAQGRARPSLCRLYQWMYRSLGNLPHVLKETEFQTANPSFYYDYQLINVEDFNGVGETEPTPHFYQVSGGRSTPCTKITRMHNYSWTIFAWQGETLVQCYLFFFPIFVFRILERLNMLLPCSCT